MNKSKPYTITVYLTDKKNGKVETLVKKGLFKNKTAVLEKALDMLLSMQRQKKEKENQKSD